MHFLEFSPRSLACTPPKSSPPPNLHALQLSPYEWALVELGITRLLHPVLFAKFKNTEREI